MQKFKVSEKQGSLLTIFITIILICVYYFEIIITSNSYLMSLSGDSLKNFYTLYYYVINDSATWFTGMNHPYGEHLVFTDAQPLLAFVLKMAVQVYPNLTNYIQSIEIWILFLSIVVGARYLYKTMIRLDISPFLSTLSAPIILMMSPQLLRFGCHFGLAYVCFVPMILYYLVSYYINNKQRDIVLLFLIITLFSFLHLYYLAIGLLTMLCYGVVYLIFNKKIEYKILLGIGVTYAIIKSYLSFTDPIKDRPNAVFGLTTYCSNWYEIICSKQAIMSIFNSIIKPNFEFEGYCYVGVFVIVVLLFALVNYKLTAQYFNKNPLIKIITITSLMVLLVSFAFPFNISYFEKFIVYLPAAYKQFRSVGRFSWVFYYIISIVAVHYCQNYFTTPSIKYKSAKKIILIIFFLLWCVDMNMYNNMVVRELQLNRAPFDLKSNKKSFLNTLASNAVEISSVQSILYYPFCHVGSEKMGFAVGGFEMGMLLSMYSDLPLIGASLSRTSFDQVASVSNILNSEQGFKDFKKILKNDTSILVVIHQNNLTKKTDWIVKYLDYIYPIGNYNVYLFSTSNREYIKLCETEFKPYSRFNTSIDIDFEPQNKKTNHRKGSNYILNDEPIFTLLLDTISTPLDSIKIAIWTYANPATAGLQRLRIFLQNDKKSQIYYEELEHTSITKIEKRWVQYESTIKIDSAASYLILKSNIDEVYFGDLKLIY